MNLPRRRIWHSEQEFNHIAYQRMPRQRFRRAAWSVFRDLFGIVWLAVMLCIPVLEMLAPPAPLPRPVKPTPLKQRLSGKWTMHWGSSRWDIVLAPDGGYTCSNYTGTWGVDSQGRFWITESCDPGNPDGWHSYAIRLDERLTGKIEIGGDMEVRLERAK